MSDADGAVDQGKAEAAAFSIIAVSVIAFGVFTEQQLFVGAGAGVFVIGCFRAAKRSDIHAK